MKTLEIVAHGLAYAAGVELAYMLFTPGPDEAIEPVILGLVSGLLLTISNADGSDIFQSLGIIIFVLALALLFVVRAIFVKETELAIEVPFIMSLTKYFIKKPDNGN